MPQLISVIGVNCGKPLDFTRAKLSKTGHYDNLPIAYVIARGSLTSFLNSFKSLDVSSPTLETLLLFHISSILCFDLSDSGIYCNFVTQKVVGIPGVSVIDFSKCFIRLSMRTEKSQNPST